MKVVDEQVDGIDEPRVRVWNEARSDAPQESASEMSRSARRIEERREAPRERECGDRHASMTRVGKETVVHQKRTVCRRKAWCTRFEDGLDLGTSKRRRRAVRTAAGAVGEIRRRGMGEDTGGTMARKNQQWM